MRLPNGIERYRGYNYIFNPQHPFSTKQGYIGEHRLVAEKALSKLIPIKHPIHHWDGIRNNNLNPNLVVCENNAYHRLIHVRLSAFKACGHANWIKCGHCDGYHDPNDLDVYIRSNKPYGWKRSCRNKYLKNKRDNRKL